MVTLVLNRVGSLVEPDSITCHAKVREVKPAGSGRGYKTDTDAERSAKLKRARLASAKLYRIKKQALKDAKKGT